MKKKKTVRIAVLGAAGRMGQALVRCSSRFPGLSLNGAVEAAGSPGVGKDAGIVAGVGAAGVIISGNAGEVAGNVDVLVDFSARSAASGHARLAAELRKGMVMGTTGLDEAQAADIKKAAEIIPIVWSPNMSLGMNLLFNLVEQSAGLLRGYDVEIIETHHRHKKDAPSGTALRLAEAAAAARNLDPQAVLTHGRHGQTGERLPDQIGVHAVRSGDVVGDHTVILATDGERLELTHRASSRDCFAMGALRAAEWVAGRAPGLYSMQNVLGIAG